MAAPALSGVAIFLINGHQKTARENAGRFFGGFRVTKDG